MSGIESLRSGTLHEDDLTLPLTDAAPSSPLKGVNMDLANTVPRAPDAPVSARTHGIYSHYGCSPRRPGVSSHHQPRPPMGGSRTPRRPSGVSASPRSGMVRRFQAPPGQPQGPMSPRRTRIRTSRVGDKTPLQDGSLSASSRFSGSSSSFHGCRSYPPPLP
ncbi:hypothetical protein KIPB_003267 [Kipferlia bialata]|uniref:Uncharacterized protein n=1 Tax=Kipferlia bialata TaxID=797122 RepID=A0A9K3CU72_9EUKA|nr:hypothetical protein KIPB_003267 [Kipferlia bialata]|eukprot:g3267.t1